MTPTDVERIRGFYNMFDTQSDGVVSRSEIKNLHERLGEPLSEEEAAAAEHELDPLGEGITFEKFLWWWFENHKDGKRGSKYTARFKLLSAKLEKDDSDFTLSSIKSTEVGQPGTLEYRINYYYKSRSGQVCVQM